MSDKDAMMDAHEVSEIVKTAVREEATGLIAEALKPITEKSAELAEYADSIKELERKKSEVPPESKNGLGFARYARAIAMGRGDRDRALFEARKAWGGGDYIVKALSVNDASAAGDFVPTVYASEFIELLRNSTTVRKVARVIPMPNGNLTMRKQTAAATASYVGEASNATETNLSVGSLNLSFKKLVALTAASNSWLRFGGTEADALVRDDLLAVMAIKEDTTFLTGTGESNTPKGLDNLVNSSNLFNDAGTTAANQFSDYAKAIRLVEAANVPVTEQNGYFLMHPQVYWGIFGTAGGAGDVWPFQPMLDRGELLGYKVYKSSNVSSSSIYFVHGPSLLIGDSLNLAVEAFDGGAYYDGSNVVSGVSRDETVIRVISEHDFNMRHDLAASIIQTVTVGA